MLDAHRLRGMRNNYWYDYRSDLEEAESELGKDLRRAKTAQDRREAYAEYDQRTLSTRARIIRRKCVERGYLRRVAALKFSTANMSA